MSDVSIVIVAAGESLRFGGNKLTLRAAGRTVLEHAIAAVRRPLGDPATALVVRAGALEEAQRSWQESGLVVVAGGDRRQDSVRRGFDALAPADDVIVAIHDAARPFVPPADVTRVVAEASESGAALLAAPVVDTIKRLRRDSTVESTVPRENLARALTPQAFRAGVLRRAWEQVGDGGVWTDEAALVERCGGEVRAVSADPRNVKVTRPEDATMLQGLFPVMPRVGQGIDVHPLTAGRPLWLCGVELPEEVGLTGHSDADVALHAVVDAILGACGDGDIGRHFPPSEERWRDAPSHLFVRHALELAAKRGLRPTHCDLTIMAERPRIAPYHDRMRARLAELLRVPSEGVNVKATTCEGMGFVGRREGVVALALVTLEQS